MQDRSAFTTMHLPAAALLVAYTYNGQLHFNGLMAVEESTSVLAAQR